MLTFWNIVLSYSEIFSHSSLSSSVWQYIVKNIYCFINANGENVYVLNIYANMMLNARALKTSSSNLCEDHSLCE